MLFVQNKRDSLVRPQLAHTDISTGSRQQMMTAQRFTTDTTDVNAESVLPQWLAKIVHQLHVCRGPVAGQFADAHHAGSNGAPHC